MLFCLLLDLPSFIETLHSAAAGLNKSQERSLQVGWQTLQFHYKPSVQDKESLQMYIFVEKKMQCIILGTY